MGFFSAPTLEQRKKRRGLLRAGGYLLVLSGAFSLIQIRQARAEVGDRTMEIGRQMMTLANASQHDVNRLNLNGQSLFMGSSVSNDSVTAVLDRYESLCQQGRAQPAEEWKALAEKSGNEGVKKGAAGSGGIVRSGEGNEGSVICFTKTTASKPTFGEAVHTFAQTGELGALGAVRYVYAHKSAKGNTVVLTAWTDEQFNLKSFMGDHSKDCAGEDFEGIGRPNDSIRVMSGRVENTPFGVNIYESHQTPNEVVSGLDRSMGEQGWVALDVELDKLHPDDAHHPVGRAYEKNGLILSVASHVEPKSTFTTMGLAGVTGQLETGTEKKKKLVPNPVTSQPAPAEKTEAP